MEPRPGSELRQEIADAILYVHSRVNSNTSKTLESSAFLYALVELLRDKGIVSIGELDERKNVVAERLMAQYRENGAGVVFQDPEIDKYQFQGSAEVDCAAKMHLCHAACCRLPFALSRQDVKERVIQWDLSRPYIIAHKADGYCCHLGEGHHCTVREQRPVPCRAYDCRRDSRIWQDFEAGVVNPDILEPEWPFPVEDGKEGA